MSVAVVITGVGMHTAAGDGPASRRALALQTPLLQAYYPPGADGLAPQLAAVAAPLHLHEQLADRKLLKYMSRTTQLAVLAAGRALDDAGLRGNVSRLGDCALYVATGPIAFDMASGSRFLAASQDARGELDLRRLGSQGLGACHPLLPFKLLLNMPLGLVSIVHGIGGENAVYYPGPHQGAACIEAAFRAIATGRCEQALVGAAVEQLSLMPLLAARRAGRVPDNDAPEAGLVPADVGAFVVLESLQAARQRRASVHARLSAPWLESWHDHDAVRLLPERLIEVLANGCNVDRQADSALLTGFGQPSCLARARKLIAQRAGAASSCEPDPILGHAGAAAPVLGLGLQALAFESRGASGSQHHALVASADPAGGLALFELAREEYGR